MVFPLKNKEGTSIANALLITNPKTNKIWVDKECEFHNRSMKSWLQDNDVVMYLTHNEENTIAAERFIGTLKNKI